MKKCPYCGRDNADDANVCYKCFAGFPHENPKEAKASEDKNESPRKRGKK